MTLRTSVARLSVLCVTLAALAVAGCGGAEARKARHLEKGQAFLVSGNFEKARVEFQNALQIAPNDPQARYQNGIVDEKLSNPREAAQFFQGVIDISPGHVDARIHLARLYLFSGNPEKAMELIAPVMDNQANNAELLTVRAAVHVQQKDVADALADAQRAVQLAPDNEDSVAVLSGIYTSSGEIAKATALLEDAVKRIPTSVDLRLVLAQIYAGSNRQAESEGILLDLVKLKPGEKSHRIRLAQYYARLNQVDAAERTLRDGIAALPAERDLKLALVEFLAGRKGRPAAESELNAMIAAQPDDVELKFAQARFYESGADFPKSEAVYQRVIDTEKLKPAGLTARSRLAALRVKRGDLDGAEKLAGEVLAQNPRDNDGLILRGNISLAKKDPKSAIADLRAVLRDQPNSIPVLRSLARAHIANGEPAIGEETMRRAVEANPNDAAARLDFAQLLAQLGKASQAKPVINELVKQEPNNLPALDAQFRISMATQDLVTAQSAADAIVAARPKAAEGYLYQGMIAEAQKRNDEALKLYVVASQMQPEASEPLQAQVRLLAAQKQVPQALKLLDDATARAPSSPLAPNIKGEVLLASGRVVEAQEAFKVALARDSKWWVPYRGLAYAQIGAKNIDAAIGTLRQGSAAATQREPLSGALAGLFERLGRVDEAIHEYEDLVRVNPQSEVAANNLAMLLVNYRKDSTSLERAKSLATRFVDSGNPSYLDTYGWVLYKRGETAASIPVLEKVVAKLPNEPMARYHLGMAQSQGGSVTDAVENLRRALSSGARFSGIEEAQATLDKLAKLNSSGTTPKS